MNELIFSVEGLTEEKFAILQQWYRQAMVIEGIHSGNRKSDELFQQIQQAYLKEKEFHEKNKERDPITYRISRHAQKLNW